MSDVRRQREKEETMQLKIDVEMWGEDEVEGSRVIRSFEELDKLAAQVGRAVKRWVRQVPLRKRGSRTQIGLTAQWVERGAAKSEGE